MNLIIELNKTSLSNSEIAKILWENMTLAYELEAEMHTNLEKTDKLDIDYIKKIVCRYFNIPVEALDYNTRKREIVKARQISMFFSRKLIKESHKFTAKNIGNKTHAISVHSCKTVNNLIETDREFREQIHEIEKKILS